MDRDNGRPRIRVMGPDDGDPILQMAYDFAVRAGRDHDRASDIASDAREKTRSHAQDPGFPSDDAALRNFVGKIVRRLILDQLKLDRGRRNLNDPIAHEFESNSSAAFDPEFSLEDTIAEANREEGEKARQWAAVNAVLNTMSGRRRDILFRVKILEHPIAALATEYKMNPRSLHTNIWETLHAVREKLGVPARTKPKAKPREKNA